MSIVNSSTTLVSGYSLGTAWTYSTSVLQYTNASFHVVWSGADKTDNNITLNATNDGTNYYEINCLRPLAASGSNCLFNLKNIGYSDVQLSYDNVSVTTGTANVYLVRKSII